jgi:hypothetical protein
MNPDVAASNAANALPPLPLLPQNCVETQLSDRMRWYSWWVNEQIKDEPKETFSCLPDYESDSEDRWAKSFVILWQEIWRHMTADASTSIDELISHLTNDKALVLSTDPAALAHARNLVFAIIGWQTMLYRSNLHSCPQVQLAIADEMDGHKGQGHMCLKQSQSCCKKYMHDFLLGFGILLPPRNFEALEAVEDKQAFKELRVADVAAFNAYFLTSIGGLNIKWIDSLACHLELDPDLNTVFLFRYPSFCATYISLDKANTMHKSAIHACAAPYSSKQWATEDDVEQMLYETILSYRLLFGQNKAARQLFRKLKPFERVPEEGRDELLMTLCGYKHCQTNLELRERDAYDLPRDFPIYRSRLAILLRHLASRKPRSWKELWQDKRDSASWLTFWVVLIFGASGIMLGLFQVILQIVQLKLQSQ